MTEVSGLDWIAVNLDRYELGPKFKFMIETKIKRPAICSYNIIIWSCRLCTIAFRIFCHYCTL